MTTTSRRAVLIGAAALSAAPAVALASPTDSDHDLRVACAEFDRAVERMDRAGALMDKTGAISEDLPEPAICKPPAELQELWRTITSQDFEALAEDHPLRVWQRTTAEARDIAETAWRAERERLRDEYGYTTAADAWEQACGDLFPVFKRVLATPAHSLAGLALKVRVVEEHDGENNDYGDGWRSISADIRRMGGAA